MRPTTRTISRLACFAVMLLSGALSASAREMHVAQTGDDAGDGSQERPYLTIARASEIAQPGDIVTVHAGTYRESVKPVRGGTDENHRITYRAAQGEEATIKGSERVTTWTQEKDGVWKVELPNAFFGDYNVFLEGAKASTFGDKHSVVDAHATGLAVKDQALGTTITFSVNDAPLRVQGPQVDAALVGVFPTVGQSMEDRHGNPITVDTDRNGKNWPRPLPGPLATLTRGDNTITWSLFGSCARIAGAADEMPPAWKVLPIPRYADYGSPDEYLTAKNVAVVRREGGPYQTVRDESGELVGQSTIVEEELLRILRERGINSVTSVPDNLDSYRDYDTLILVGRPEHNAQTQAWFAKLQLSFSKWDDPNTPEHDFQQWSDFGREGHLLKVGRVDGQNIVLLAGYDFDDARQQFIGAGTFYAVQSLEQLIDHDGAAVRIKTAEIADKPWVVHRGCYSGFQNDEPAQWRAVAMIPRIKANQNIYWYGNNLGAYNVEAASRFRYPWKPDQLALFAKIGKYCRERYVTMVFCMNADHYNVEWAAPKTFDGKEKDPIHYDLNHPLEPQIKELWATLGFTVNNDVDVLAAKHEQLHRAVPGCMLQVMNEDDVFGLVHADDKQIFQTDTDDPKQNAVHYGRARGTLLAALYRRIRERCPDGADDMPVCPPATLCYQLPLNRNEAYSREFLGELGATLKELGVAEHTPLLTTGGSTAAEVITGETIENFRTWAQEVPVLLLENNFSSFHVGAFETDPAGARFFLQIDPQYPAGYRDKQICRKVWGIQWNGIDDQDILSWCMGQYLWNLPALDRQTVNDLAVRKVSNSKSYPLVKSFCDEFSVPVSYLPDCLPPYRVLVVSRRVAFPASAANGWQYAIRYTDSLRREAENLRSTLGRCMPQLETQWEATSERQWMFNWLGYPAYSFCTVYLANGYIKGWENEVPDDELRGLALRELYLEADDIQERFFAGPLAAPGKPTLLRHFYGGFLRYLYSDGRFTAPPESPTQADSYVDVWKLGLQGKFFEPVTALTPADVPDNHSALISGWGPRQEMSGETFRTVDTAPAGGSHQAVLALGQNGTGPWLVRARLGTESTSVTDAVKVRLSTNEAQQEEAVCKPRWINWLLPANATLSTLTISAEKPGVRVYAVQVYRASP